MNEPVAAVAANMLWNMLRGVQPDDRCTQGKGVTMREGNKPTGLAGALGELDLLTKVVPAVS